MRSVCETGNGGNAAIVNGLVQLLEETKSIYLKTKKYHWNATEGVFQTYNTMFENQCAELVPAFDLIAERIRILGFSASNSEVLLKNSDATSEMKYFLEGPEMIKDLLVLHELFVGTALSVFSESVKLRDDLTADLITRRIRAHQRTVFVLRSLLNT
jgi:starvation-inducible DNA-binding protein